MSNYITRVCFRQDGELEEKTFHSLARALEFYFDCGDDVFELSVDWTMPSGEKWLEMELVNGPNNLPSWLLFRAFGKFWA